MLTVSVVIPSYNHARFLPKAIESALGQTLKPLEVIVVDDGSRDSTGDVLAEYADRVTVVRQKNSGVAAARNRGVAISRGDVIAFLDADDEWLPEKLEMQVRRLEQDPRVGLVHCAVQEIDGAGLPLETHEAGMEGDGIAREMLFFRRPVILGGGSGVVIRRTLFDEIGGFDLALSTSADWDLYYRAATRTRVAFVNQRLLRYRLHGSNMHGNIAAMERDMLRAYGKAFAGATPDLERVRRECYGNLHRVLAGSYFGARKYGPFLRHSLQVARLAPRELATYASFPVRRLRRALGRQVNSAKRA
ncbi:MAG: glycosyltransferase family 2 protein [Polyangiales bacterium]